jgi:hypothetical protein
VAQDVGSEFKPSTGKTKHFKLHMLKLKNTYTRCQWLTPVILATQEAEILGIMIQSQSWQTVHETLSQKSSSQKRPVGVAQAVRVLAGLV